jgi:cytochrome c553
MLLPFRARTGGALFAALLTSPLPVQAQFNSAPRLGMECAPCHGFDGIGHDDGIPNLAGQHRAYLDRQVLAFRGGVRLHPEMNFFARQASQDEVTEILGPHGAARDRARQRLISDQNLMELRPATMKASGMACVGLSGLSTLPPGWMICWRSAWMVHHGASCRL